MWDFKIPQGRQDSLLALHVAHELMNTSYGGKPHDAMISGSLKFVCRLLVMTVTPFQYFS